MLALVSLNESAGGGTSTWTSELSIRNADTAKAEAEISRKMTMEHAIHTVRHMRRVPYDVVSALDQLQPRLIHISSRHTHLRYQQSPSGPNAAKTKLNEMIHETQVKLDLELIRCSTFERTQLALLEKLRQDISTFDAAAAAAASEMLRAQAEISIYQQKLPATELQLTQLLSGCKKSKLELEHQLLIVKADINVMQKVMEMTQCNSRTLLLLACRDPVSGKKYTHIGDDELRRHISQLQHPAAQELLQNGIEDDNDYPSDEEEMRNIPPAFVQEGEETEMDTEEESEDTDSEDEGQFPGMMTTLAPNATVPPAKRKQRSKCSIAGSPACPALRERFMDIATGIEDKRDELETELRELEKRCKEGKASLDAQIALYQQTLKKEETALAQATSEKTTNEEQSRLTNIEYNTATKEYNQMMAQCKVNIATFRSEKCGLSKIRGELYKLSKITVFIQDCEVSDWKASECSATCGGGTQILTRTITVQPASGAACANLQAAQSCSEDACPVDCVLNDWSGWSGCSADCGGGVRSKTRAVINPPEHGGESCGETTKTESCNVQACDVPCVLSDWTAWEACSKACDGGSTIRVKNVVDPPIGQGECPAQRTKERLQRKPCHTQPCANSTVHVLKCVAKLDVILLLDASGSMKKDGWDDAKKAGANLARAMGPDIKLAALQFSGPTSYQNLWKCIGVTSGQPDMENDCGIKWVDHFMDNVEDVARDIENLDYPEQTTLTSLALSTAETELAYGRDDAKSVVIVVTDGKPLSEHRTSLAVESLKTKARVIWVTVGRYVPKKDVRRWASFPWQENLVKVRSFKDLNKPYILNQILSDACPLLEQP